MSAPTRPLRSGATHWAQRHRIRPLRPSAPFLECALNGDTQVIRDEVLSGYRAARRISPTRRTSPWCWRRHTGACVDGKSASLRPGMAASHDHGTRGHVTQALAGERSRTRCIRHRTRPWRRVARAVTFLDASAERYTGADGPTVYRGSRTGIFHGERRPVGRDALLAASRAEASSGALLLVVVTLNSGDLGPGHPQVAARLVALSFHSDLLTQRSAALRSVAASGRVIAVVRPLLVRCLLQRVKGSRTTASPREHGHKPGWYRHTRRGSWGPLEDDAPWGSD